MRMSISPDISELSPGDEVELTVKMANDGSEEIIPILEVAGLSADLWRLANPIPVIPAGEIGQTSILVRVPLDTPPGDRRISVTVRSPLDNSAASAPAALRVGAGDVLAVEASPSAVSGRKGAGLSAIVHNRGSEDLTLRIAGSSQGAAVEVKPAEFRLLAGQSTRVKARFTRAKRSWFRERKHGVVFDVRGHTVPATTTAMFVQRPVVPPVLLRSLAVLVALAVWASAVFVIFTSMAATEEAGPDTGEVVDTGPLPPPPPVVLPDPDADPAALNGQVAPPVVIQGAVEGPRNPADTVVVIERVSFGDQGTTNGTGKVAASATPVALASGSVLDKVRTTTDERGRFRVASGLRAGAFYRVSALRAGFEVRSVVVSTNTSTEIDLALTLIPANGQMSGKVVDSNGAPLGGVTVEATQGLITYRTVTSSSGEDAGKWTIDALATPATYLITVRQLGYASQTLTRDLDGGQALGGVDAVLTANMGTIRGQITYRDAGVGAITVNLDGDGGKRETTTLTDGPLAGNFTIPSLPYGTYLLTFSGEGWMTQSREVTVDTGDVVVSVRDIVPSTGIIQGIVAQQTVSGGCKYPDTTGTVSEALAPSPCGGVGVTVVNDDGIWRTTTATSDGSFLFSNIPAGEYTVKFERFGYLPEFYTVRLKPGDVVNVPGDATYDAALASALTGRDSMGPLSTTQVQLRVRPAAPLDEGIIEGFIRDITAQEIAFDDPSLGAFRDGWKSLTCNGPGSKVQIVIVGATSTDCELLDGGGYRLSNVMSGVQRIRFNIAGYDEAITVVRVAPNGISSGGVVNLMPRASVTLNLSSGGEVPVARARVFVGPLAVDGSTIDDSAAGVDKCAVFLPRGELPFPEIWREVLPPQDPTDKSFQDANFVRFGLCSDSDLSGDALFPASLGPGGVDIITPVNTSDPTTSAALARTVPLDHRQLVRTLIVAAGENVRLDLRLRRYPVIVGSVQEPRNPGPGFQRVDVTTSGFPSPTGAVGVTFCEVDPSDPDKGCLNFEDPLIQPRLSVGIASGLNQGQFRIDRIPPNEGNRTRIYRLVFASENGTFSRDPAQDVGGIENMVFGEERAISALMAPTPLTFRFGFRVAGSEEALPGGFIRVTGTTEYRALDTAPFQEVLRVLCPGPDCNLPMFGDDGRTMTVEPLTRNDDDNVPFLGAAQGSYYSLRASSQIRFVNVFRSGLLEVEAIVPGYDPVTFTIPAPPAANELIPVEFVARPRRVETTIFASPTPFNHSGLTATLVPVAGGIPISVQPAASGATAFPSVNPGRYVLRITGPGVFPVAIGDTPSDPADPNSSPVGIAIVPGVGAQILNSVAVDQQLTLNVRVRNQGAAVPGAQVVIQRTDGAPLEDGAANRTLLTCTAAAGSGGAPGCVTAGDAPFTGLRVADYEVIVSAAGFVGTQTRTVPVTAVTQNADFTFDRYGTVTGTVEGLPGPGLPEIPLPGAQVTIITAGGTELATVSTATDGRFTISNLAQIPEGAGYRLRVTYPGYDTFLTPVDQSFEVSNNSTTALGEIELVAAPATFSGTVLDGAGPLGLSGVTVSVLVDGNLITGAEYTAVSGPDGSFSVKVPPGRAATLRFEDRDPEGRLLRPIVERIENLSGGQVRAGQNINMAAGFGAITGTVLLRDRDGATEVAAASAAVTVIRTNDDSIGAVTQSATAVAGSFSIASIRTGTYIVTVSAAGYTTNVQTAAIVPLNGTFTASVTLIAAPRDVTVTLSSSTSSTISGVTVFASSAGQTTLSEIVEAGSASVTFTGLQPGDWTVTTSGGPSLEIPHLDITNGSFTLSPGEGTSSPTVTNSELIRYAKITGSVELQGYDNSVTVPVFDWTVSNAALTATGPSGTALVTTSGTNTFTIWAPSAGDWTLQIVHDDFVTTSETQTATLSADVAVGPIALFPAPRDVSVLVISEALAGGPSGLNGLTLVASPPPGSALTPITAAAGADAGSYEFLQLAPGTWTIATSGGSGLDVPHMDATASVVVPLGTASISIDDPIISYVALSGEVSGQDYVGAAVSPLSGVIVTATQSAQAITTVSAESTALWSMGVLPEAQIDLSWSKVGYQTAIATIVAADVTGSGVVSDVTLSASTRDVTVTVAGAPDGLELRASFDGLTSVDASISGETATFVGLAPGLWSVESVNSLSLNVIPFAGIDVTVSVATTEDLNLVIADPLITLNDLSVDVTGVNFSGATDPVALSAASVTIASGEISLDLTTNAGGVALLKTSAGLTVDVTVSAAGYATTTSAVSVSSASTTLPVELVALERLVTVKVTSSAATGGIDGVTVSAVSAVSAPGTEPSLTDSSGEANFVLAPGEWTFEVTGAEDTGHLNVGPLNATDGAPQILTVPVGDSAVTVEFSLILQPFDATVSGTVFLVTGDDSASVSAVTESVTVRATSGGFTREVASSSSGEYVLVLTGDRPWEVTVQGFAGTTTTSVTPTAGSDVTVDVYVSELVRNIGGQITGTSGDVTISATANGFATISQTISGSGQYEFTGLNALVTWTITFSDGTVTVTRFVGPGGNESSLDQDLADAASGSIEVNLTDTALDLRDSDLVVTVTLSDPNAFPRIAGGSITQTVTLTDSVSLSAVTFPNLVTTSGSPPFTITVTADGYASHTRTDVSPGTPVEINLVPSTRTVVLTLTKQNGATVAVVPQLFDGIGVTLSATVDPDFGNVFTFTGVTPGDWIVKVDGYVDEVITVPIGDPSVAVQISVTLTSIAVGIEFEVAGEVTTSAFVVAGDPDPVSVTIRLVDVDGDVVISSENFTVTVSTEPAPPTVLVLAPTSGLLAAGVGTFSIEAPDVNGGSGVVTVTVGTVSATLAITIEPDPI